MKEWEADISKRLKLLRVLGGLSQRELAEKLNPEVSQSTIRKIEAGENMPSFSTFFRLLEFFKMTPL